MKKSNGMGKFIRIAMHGLAACVLSFGFKETALAGTDRASDANLETFRLADMRNLKNLPNGDFLFRIAREKNTGITYWAYLGATRHVIAMVPDPKMLGDAGAARRIVLRVTNLPTRVGCGVGLIHQSFVYVVPEDVKFGEKGYAPEASPLYAVGEVRNDLSGRTPTKLLSLDKFDTWKRSVDASKMKEIKR